MSLKELVDKAWNTDFQPMLEPALQILKLLMVGCLVGMIVVLIYLWYLKRKTK